MKRSFNENMY